MIIVDIEFSFNANLDGCIEIFLAMIEIETFFWIKTVIHYHMSKVFWIGFWSGIFESISFKIIRTQKFSDLFIIVSSSIGDDDDLFVFDLREDVSKFFV